MVTRSRQISTGSLFLKAMALFVFWVLLSFVFVYVVAWLDCVLFVGVLVLLCCLCVEFFRVMLFSFFVVLKFKVVLRGYS